MIHDLSTTCRKEAFHMYIMIAVLVCVIGEPFTIIGGTIVGFLFYAFIHAATWGD